MPLYSPQPLENTPIYQDPHSTNARFESLVLPGRMGYMDAGIIPKPESIRIQHLDPSTEVRTLLTCRMAGYLIDLQPTSVRYHVKHGNLTRYGAGWIRVDLNELLSLPKRLKKWKNRMPRDLYGRFKPDRWEQAYQASNVIVTQSPLQESGQSPTTDPVSPDHTK